MAVFRPDGLPQPYPLSKLYWKRLLSDIEDALTDVFIPFSPGDGSENANSMVTGAITEL